MTQKITSAYTSIVSIKQSGVRNHLFQVKLSSCPRLVARHTTSRFNLNSLGSPKLANHQGMTGLNKVCACARLWSEKRILSRLHVRFSILLLLGVVSLPLFFYRTISKNFVHPQILSKKQSVFPSRTSFIERH